MRKYKKSEVIGLLLNLGLEPKKIETRIEHEYNLDGTKFKNVNYLIFDLNTESLLNIFPSASDSMNENRKIASSNLYKGVNSTIGVKFGTIDLKDDERMYSDFEVFGMISQIYNGRNVADGNLLIFRNAEVDKYMDKYRESLKHVVNINAIETANKNIGSFLYNTNNSKDKNASIMELLTCHVQRKKDHQHEGEALALTKKINNIKKLCSMTDKINTDTLIDTVYSCHNKTLKNNTIIKRAKRTIKPNVTNAPKLYNGEEVKENI